jgi:RHS repeat-associated protein
VIKKIDYDSFGNIIDDTDPTFEIPFGFVGGLHDQDTGLVRFGYRDYDPDIGRWTAKDPIFFVGSDTDLYGYCLNNPINLVDPAGEVGMPGAVVGVILGASAGFTSGIASGNPSAGFWSGLAGAVAGGIAGGAVGFFAPNASPVIGGIVGGLIGGATADAVNVRLKEGPCANFRQYANSAVFGGVKGAVLGGFGGGIVSSAAMLGATGAAVETAASLITMPVNLGADIVTSSLLKH